MGDNYLNGKQSKKYILWSWTIGCHEITFGLVISQELTVGWLLQLLPPTDDPNWNNEPDSCKNRHQKWRIQHNFWCSPIKLWKCPVPISNSVWRTDHFSMSSGNGKSVCQTFGKWQETKSHLGYSESSLSEWKKRHCIYEWVGYSQLGNCHYHCDYKLVKPCISNKFSLFYKGHCEIEVG